MPLPVPKLDDRRFQDIVDQAKTLIPRYTPEWTDHNVSDPGVALIELFAWMTDMLLYRVNQVPDKLYVKFLELIGVRLDPPRAANAPVTFYLSAPQPNTVTIPADTEVATVRTETERAIVFTTEKDLPIRPPELLGAFTRAAAGADGGAWIAHDLRQLSLPGQDITIFSDQPAPGDAFYLALGQDHSRHILALVLGCELAGGAGVDPNNPPLEWQVWQGGAARWANCEIEYDGTGGFNRSGDVIMHAPAMAEGEFGGQRAYWLRCRLTAAQAGAGAYRVSPKLQRLRVESRGGTVAARHAVTIVGETLGQSDGTPGQTFNLLATPLLARDPARDYLIVEPPGAQAERWEEVADFADSHDEERHYTIDSLDGTLTLGPALLQPDGRVFRFGAAPPKGSTLRFSRYQSGGGIIGNVPRGALAVLKSSIPYVSRVVNRESAVGGRDAQSLDDAKLRAPQTLRTRTRAVTVDDYEYLARQVPGVARAACLAPGAQPGDPTDPRPGQLFVLIVPQADTEPGGAVAPEDLTLSVELRGAVLSYLDDRRLLGTALDVQPPQYLRVAVEAILQLPDRHDEATAAAVTEAAQAALYRYLNPFTGGPGGDGWPFGRDLHVSELYALLQRIPSVEFVEGVRMTLVDGGGVAPPTATRLTVPRHAIVCSAQHRVGTR